MLLKRPLLLTSLIVTSLLPLGACANSPWAESLERSLAADPRLEENPAVIGSFPNSNGADEASSQAQLPMGFPAEIPLYPNAELTDVTQPTSAQAETRTVWTTSDSALEVQQFYQNTFESGGWEVSALPAGAAGSATDGPNEAPNDAPDNAPNDEPDEALDGGTIVAERDGWRVTVAVEPTTPEPEAASPSVNANPSGSPTEFLLAYVEEEAIAPDQASDPDQPSLAVGDIPQPGDPDFIGPVFPGEVARADRPFPRPTPRATTAGQSFTDLDEAPEELRSHIEDVAALGVFNSSTNEDGAASEEFQPNETLTRREYARWLVTANNLMFSDRPAQRIRFGTATAQPAFQDVPPSDPDFGVIQGLAEAGLIPSPLAGDVATVTFRPDAPLTREELILWKTPIDTRQPLPNATIEAVQQTWGFQDAPRIEPRALRAVLADYQNSDLANIRRAFGYTTLFQPKKAVTRAEAAAVLWYFGSQGEGSSAQDVLQTERQVS